MPTWNCLIVGTHPDGSYTWRRADAARPRGVLPTDKTPPGVWISAEVTITAMRDDSGEWDVTHCQLQKIETVRRDDFQIESQSTEMPQIKSHIHFPEIRWTDIRNPLEDAQAVGKLRPAVMMSEEADRWRVMGLTTKSTYEDGLARIRVPDHQAVGLNGPGFLWGHRLTRVNTEDIGTYIGRANCDLLNAILQLARADLTMAEIAMLRRESAIT